MQLKKILSGVLSAALILGVLPTASWAASAEVPVSDVLYDDFNGDTLDNDKWLVAHKQWGGKNGGVVKENVSISDGLLKLEGHGLNYTGDVPGIKREDGTLTGAAIASREYYASGSYEVVAKVAPELGACSALWTFEYEEYYPGEEGYIPELATYKYCTVNHEIDIEIPTGLADDELNPSFNNVRFNTYVRENDYTPHYQDVGFALNDGKFHTFRFDWHTGDVNEQPRVEFYIDDCLQYTSYSTIPTNAGRFWIGLWFPYSIDSDKDGVEDIGWSGLADFDTTVFEIDSVKITPFHEAGDTEQHETSPYDGWAENSFPELAEQENFEHIQNGDFAQGQAHWTLFDEAAISGGKAHLTSGQVPDQVYQIMDVIPSATYTITADVVTDGAEVRVGASKPNGSMDHYISTTKSGKVSITFNNESANPLLKVYAMVDRWQGDNVHVSVDNISMYGTSYVEEPVLVFIPADTEPTPEPDVPEQPTEPQPTEPQPTEPQPTEPNPEAPSGVNLVQNGNFAAGKASWELSGGAAVTNKGAVLASGSDTDTISQLVHVEKGQTYTLSADVTTPGAEVTFGVKDYNGRYTEISKTVSQPGTYSLTFTTASHIDQVTVYATVLRYQKSTADCTVTNIALVQGTSAITPPEVEPEKPPVEPDVPAEPEIPVEPDVPEIPVESNLLVNPSFAGASGWTLTGNARIESETALLDSGKDTDTISQIVKLEPNTTYRFSADLVTPGVVVDLKISDFNGRYSEKTESFAVSGNGVVEFTTGSSAKNVKVTLQVLRYQSGKGDARIRSASLVKVK